MGPLEISDELIKSFYNKNEDGIIDMVCQDNEMEALEERYSETMLEIQNLIGQQCLDYGHHYAKVAYAAGIKEGIHMAMTIRNIYVETRPRK